VSAAMPAAIQQLLAVLARLTRQLQANMIQGTDFVELAQLCSQTPSTFPARDCQPLIRCGQACLPVLHMHMGRASRLPASNG
jgi:hypothetical protein